MARRSAVRGASCRARVAVAALFVAATASSCGGVEDGGFLPQPPMRDGIVTDTGPGVVAGDVGSVPVGSIASFVCPAWTDVGPSISAGEGPVWARTPGDAWWLQGGQLFHWDGARVTMTPAACELAGATDLAGADGELWATTVSGTVWRRDTDGDWSRYVVNDTGGALHAVVARARDEVWVVGDRALVARWDGDAWARERVGDDEDLALAALWVPARDDVWVAGHAPVGGGDHRSSVLHRAGASGVWQRSLDTAGRIGGIAGRAPDRVAVAGARGDGVAFVLEHDGVTWRELVPPAQAVSGEVRIAGGDTRGWWIHGAGTALTRQVDGAWVPLVDGEGAPVVAADVSILSSEDAWIGTAVARRVHDGVVEAMAPGCCTITAISGGGPSDVWLFGAQGLAWHWDGARFTYDPFARSQRGPSFDAGLHGAARAADGTTWVVGWRGEAWLRGPEESARWVARAGVDPAVTLRGVWAAGRERALAVGHDDDVWPRRGVVFHWEGQAWREDAALSRLGGAFLAIAGRAEDDLWVVGDGDKAWHFDGARWKSLALGITARLEEVVVTPAGRAFGLGSVEGASVLSREVVIVELSHDGATVNRPGAPGSLVGAWGDERGLVAMGEAALWLDGGARRGLAPVIDGLRFGDEGALFDDGTRLWVGGREGNVYWGPPLPDLLAGAR